MNNLPRTSFLLSISIVIFSLSFSQSTTNLWFTEPAEYFEESFVMGNGKYGLSIFGDPFVDSIYLNDITLWSGEPVRPTFIDGAPGKLHELREALKNEDYKKADELYKQFQGPYSQSYAPLGKLFLQFNHKGAIANYQRKLNLKNAISTISYTVDDVEFTREYFVSHPDQLAVIHLTTNQAQSLSFSINFKSLLKYHSETTKTDLISTGYAPYHADPVYYGKEILFHEDRGTRFANIVRVADTDGEIIETENGIEVNEASYAILHISIATSFNGFDKNPSIEGKDALAIANTQLARTSLASIDQLKNNHIVDYQRLFSRVSLDLGDVTAPSLPTNQRLERYAIGKQDKNLEILYFNFGRYLLISSSRTDGVPANLQGLWNPYLQPPWSSNYTININLQENYWLAEKANLSEMHKPLLQFVGNLSKTGEITAKEFFNAKGWMAAHNSDIWALSNPVGDYGNGHPSWANWNMGGVWLATHLWEHYLYTKDKTFLSETAYPILKGAALFAIDMLVEDKQGYLVPSPSTSPENQYITPIGYKGSTLYGATVDIALTREILEETKKVALILQKDIPFSDSLDHVMQQLYPYQIGRDGSLMEWYYDWDDVDPKHRHQSHLIGVYPFHQISLEKNPKLATAAKKSLELKGDKTTGWSKGWRINLWARLGEGNRAYKMFRELLHVVEPDGKREKGYNPGGTYPNLLDAHPPFQIDGNFGGAAGVIEMLLQSTENDIIFLPALPDQWPNGSVSGLRAKGGFVVDFTWKNKKITSLRIFSESGGTTLIHYNGKKRMVDFLPQETIELRSK